MTKDEFLAELSRLAHSQGGKWHTIHNDTTLRITLTDKNKQSCICCPITFLEYAKGFRDSVGTPRISSAYRGSAETLTLPKRDAEIIALIADGFIPLDITRDDYDHMRKEMLRAVGLT